MSDDTPDFGGLRVAAFESRKAGETARMIERFGGRPFVSPAMREVPLPLQPAVLAFAHELLTGRVEIVIFLTGVGFRQLLAAIERQVPRQRFLDALTDVTTVARGPKPVAAMREVGLTPTLIVPEPNTWRELLTTLDQHGSLVHQTVALQEYGKPNASLVAGLEARGARVLPLQVYRWDFPADVEPLRENLRRLAAAELDVVLFTSAHQVTNVLRMAEDLNLVQAVIRGLRRAVVASVGPTTSEMLRACELPVDVEPSHPKLGHLLAEAATRSPVILRERRSQGIGHGPIAAPSPVGPAAAPWSDGPFLRACRREPVPYTPIWLMRQAGRYMPEYRRVRAKTGFLELCKNPQLCSEVMVTAVARLHVDAAIIFSDLLPILEPMGLQLEYAAGDGPIIHNPVRTPQDVDRIREVEDPSALGFVMETVRQTRRDLPAAIPLIGFAGAPFTLASYVIEGGSSRSYAHTKRLMYRDAGAWQSLMERIARSLIVYLNGQIAAGAQCVQLFDSWVGCLGPDDYQRFVMPTLRQVIAGIVPDVPVISFGTGNPSLLPLQASCGATIIGVDWRVRLDQAWQAIGHDKAIQGNLDPGVLLADTREIRRQAAAVLQQAGSRPGHIFNLGHGILKETPVEHAVALVDLVHEMSRS